MAIPNDMMKPDKMKLDQTDLTILKELQANSRLSNNELAKRINLSQPAAHNRLKRLKSSGIIQDFTVTLDWEKLGYELVCFFQTRLAGHTETDVADFEAAVSAFPQVLECHYITGEYDHLIKAVFKNRQELEQFMRSQLSALPGVSKIITSLVLSEIEQKQRPDLSQP